MNSDRQHRIGRLMTNPRTKIGPRQTRTDIVYPVARLDESCRDGLPVPFKEFKEATDSPRLTADASNHACDKAAISG